MITANSNNPNFTGNFVNSFFCLSTDTKPTTGVENGTFLIEMDTSTLYFFDEEKSIWRAWA